MQGRGSAANSVVCYCLGITKVDPIACRLLFERFLSEGRKSWPDIDLDLPSGDRRESVIQEVYRRYGRHGAAMTANVITYRGRSAMREIGKVLNLPVDVIDRFSDLFANGDFPHTIELQEQVQRAGLPADHPRAQAFLRLFPRIHGLPRHLGQHSGGMVICQGQLDSIVPLENCSMPDRILVQWDKDDCDDLGIIKVDLLGLGMMAVLQDSLALCARRGRPVDLAHLPKDDQAVFDMMCAADTIGVVPGREPRADGHAAAAAAAEFLRCLHRGRHRPARPDCRRPDESVPRAARRAGEGGISSIRAWSRCWSARWASRSSRSRCSRWPW